MHLAGVADEHRILAVDHVGDRPGSVTGDVPDGHRGTATEIEGLASAHEHRRLEPAGDDRLGGGALVRRPLGILEVVIAHAAVEVAWGLAAARQRCVGLMDDDLGSAAGHLPQRVRTADVVDVTVGEEDPADVLDPAAERLEGGGHALRGGGGDARVDDRQLGCVDEEAVEVEAAPGRRSGWIGTVAVMTLRSRTGRPARMPRSTRVSRRSAARSRASRPGTG